jgi:phospholipase C
MVNSKRRKWAVAMIAALIGQPIVPAMAATGEAPAETASPIKHAIVIIGENRTFDHVFATYKARKGESVDNLLSKKIINEDGSPGPNYSEAGQFSADDTHGDKYEPSPMDKSLYDHLPAPLAGGPTNVCKNNGICKLSDATSSENGLASGYYQFLLTGGTGLTGGTPDTRITNALHLPPGPFQLTNSTLSNTFPYDSYAASPVHRFYQMWQQSDCNLGYSLVSNPSGCKADLFPWVEVTVGAGTNGLT